MVRTPAPLALVLLLAACAPDPGPPVTDRPELATRADSVAWRIATYAGAEAWEALPSLRFAFAVERDGEVTVVARHLWDRRANRYRVEWPATAPEDSVYVALFTDWPEEGSVFRGGRPVETIGGRPALEAARRRTINDTYWLLAPLKLFDPGVTRTHVPDSADARLDVVRLAFDDGVGLTPGDRYWLFADRETGRLERWTFLLQGTETPRSFRWTGYEGVPGPAGEVRLATRKEPLGGGNAILTGGLDAPEALDPADFTDPRPRLR